MFLIWSLICLLGLLMWPREKSAVRIKKLIDKTLKEEGMTNVKDAMKFGLRPSVDKARL